MEFTENDMKILVVMGFTVLLIGATAGATPVAGGFGDMPKFDSDAQLNLDAPEAPSPDVSSEGTLTIGPNSTINDQTDVIVVENGIQVEVFGGFDNNTSNVVVGMVHREVETGNVIYSANTALTEQAGIGEEHLLQFEDKGTGIIYEVESVENGVITISWNLEYHPEWSTLGDGSGDGLFNSVGNIAEWIGYIGSLIAYAFEALFSGIAFTFTVLMDITTYMFSLMGWLIGGFTTMVSGAPVWAAPFIGLPVLLLGLELLKLLLLIVDVLWIG